MPTLQRTFILKNTWVDINTATSIAVGLALDIQNHISVPIRVTETNVSPTLDSGFVVIPAHRPERGNADVYSNEAGEDRVWVYSKISGYIQVGVA